MNIWENKKNCAYDPRDSSLRKPFFVYLRLPKYVHHHINALHASILEFKQQRTPFKI